MNNKRSLRSAVKVKTKQEKETEKRIAFLVAYLSWLALLLGEARATWAPLATPIRRTIGGQVNAKR